MAFKDKFDPKDERASIWQVSSRFKKTKLDGSFQRYGGITLGSGWSVSNARGYLESFIDGAIYNRIIVADVAACLKHAKDVNDTESINYYQQIMDDGYEFVSIDGNNTSDTLTHFIESHEDLYLGSGEDKKHFKDYDEEWQGMIQYAEKIDFTILRTISKRDMCFLFRALNQSTKLNDQEYRQAMPSSLADDVREIANDNVDVFLNLVLRKPQYVDKRVHEEMTAAWLMRIETPTTRLKKGELYLKYENCEAWAPSTLNVANKVFAVVKDLAEEVGDLTSEKLKKGEWFLLMETTKFITQELELNISNKTDYFNWFLAKCQEANQIAGKVLQENLDQQSFVQWLVSYSHASLFKNACELLQRAVISNYDNLIEDGIVTHRRTSKDTFTFKQKIALLLLQNGKDREGNELTWVDLYKGLYEADHVKSVRDGGQTTLENGELMTKIANRQKGAQSNEPHFAFQQTS